MRRAIRALGAACALAAGCGVSWGWGYAAHRIVAENACGAVPSGMAAFYEGRARRVSDAGIEPDRVLKARHGAEEKRRHYIHLDMLSRPPFEDLPRTEAAARGMWGGPQVTRAGSLPWRCLEIQERLTGAFRTGDADAVIRLSGWLSHYVADAFQPLHATSNHDGVKTGQKGIHARFEAELIHRSRAAYRRRSQTDPGWVPPYIGDPFAVIRSALAESFALVDEVLRADHAASPPGAPVPEDYYERLEDHAGSIAARRLKGAVETTVALWYSAWVDAGRPVGPTEAPP